MVGDRCADEGVVGWLEVGPKQYADYTVIVNGVSRNFRAPQDKVSVAMDKIITFGGDLDSFERECYSAEIRMRETVVGRASCRVDDINSLMVETTSRTKAKRCLDYLGLNADL